MGKSSLISFSKSSLGLNIIIIACQPHISEYEVLFSSEEIQNQHSA